MNRMLKRMLAVLICALPLWAQAQLVLVENGQSRVPVVIFENAPPFTRLAAEELVDYIDKISGARPELIEGSPDPVPENAIWVGYQPVLDGLFPDINLEFTDPEEILIAATENHLVIAGRDVWDPENLYGSRQEVMGGARIDGIQQEYGTINAVYTFLQDYLGVRWLWPGELGEDIIKTDTVSFSPFEYRYNPQFRERIGIFRNYSLYRLGFRPSDAGQNWARYQRLLFDSLQIPGGHAFTDWWERFHEDHPEYLALQPDGTRGGGKNPYPRAGTVKLCHTNPDVWDQWLKDVEKQLEAHPNWTVFNAAPNDNSASGHCICADCRAWDHPDGEPQRLMWRGVSQEYVAMSDRHITFANKVARMLKERYPDKDYYVRIGAYGTWRPKPVEARPDDNVMLAMVANFHSSPRQEHLDQFLDWAEIAPNMVWRPNLGVGIWQDGLPLVAMGRVMDQLRMVADHNVIGIFFDTIWFHWVTQGPHYYMLAQMAWNPYADGEAILEDYYQRGFGPAAGDLRAYWEMMEEMNEKIRWGVDGTWRDWADAYDGYNEAFLKEAGEHLERAEMAAQGQAPYSERIDYVRMGLDFTRYYVEARELMRRYRESGASDELARKRATEIWLEKIRPLVECDVHPTALSRMAGYLGYSWRQGHVPEEVSDRW